MLYENSSIYHDDDNDLNYGSTLTKEEVEIGAIYLIKYYFYESINYTIDIKNFKKGSVEGFPLIMNIMNINDSAFFGTPITSIKANGKLHYLELEDSSDQSEIHYALFAGNDLNKAEFIHFSHFASCSLTVAFTGHFAQFLGCLCKLKFQ